MVSQLWTWIAAAVLVMVMCGCSVHREPIATVSPTFSYHQHISPADASAMWDDTDRLRDSTSVQAMVDR